MVRAPKTQRPEKDARVKYSTMVSIAHRWDDQKDRIANGMLAPLACHSGVSKRTIQRWKKFYIGQQAAGIDRLRGLWMDGTFWWKSSHHNPRI